MAAINSTFSTASVIDLARSYNPLSSKEQLRTILNSFFSHEKFAQTSDKHQLHEQINEVLINACSGESVLKYNLFREFINKNVTAAFEINVNSSRLDFLTINGDSSSFEIKSSRDNLYKLKKQSSDYSKAFEYNFVVVGERHIENAADILPSHYGIWKFKGSKKHICREAILSNSLDPEFQLTLLNVKELKSGFKEFGGVKNHILTGLNEDQINYRFKMMLKSRYQSKWSFVKNNRKDILPVDVQFFFSTNLAPRLVYQITQ